VVLTLINSVLKNLMLPIHIQSLANLANFQLKIQGISNLIPINPTVTNTAGSGAGIVNIVKTIIILLVVFLIIAAIIYAIISGFKYISSQGESSKVEEAQESIKEVLIGLVLAFVGIVLVIIISNVFSTASSTNITKQLDCILAGKFDAACPTKP